MRFNHIVKTAGKVRIAGFVESNNTFSLWQLEFPSLLE